MINLAKDGYTHEQIRDMLHATSGSREVRFRYDLLDKNDNFIAEMKTVEGGTIEQAALADIKRTAKFRLREEAYVQETYAAWSDIGNKEWSEM